MPYAPVPTVSLDQCVLGVVLSCLAPSILLSACNRESSDSAPDVRTASAESTLLSGRFESVGKTTRGTVELIARGDDYFLRLRNVKVEYDGPIHIYLVGVPSAPNTASVDNTELKYDMAPLQNGAEEQLVALPSAPDPALRSVVLWNPKYGANLANAPLQE